MKPLRSLLVVLFAVFAWPAFAQQSGTDLGSLGYQRALQGLSQPQNGDLTVIYRGPTGLAVPTAVVQPGFTMFTARGVNFNSAATDTPVAVVLPSGFTRYLITGVRISHASASISTATLGVFGAAGGGAPTIAADGAITVTQSAENTNNNSMAVVIANPNTESFNLTTIYLRVGTPQGSAATADVIIQIVPMS